MLKNLDLLASLIGKKRSVAHFARTGRLKGFNSARDKNHIKKSLRNVSFRLVSFLQRNTES